MSAGATFARQARGRREHANGRDLVVCVDPPSRHLEQDRLFDVSFAADGGADILAPYAFLRRWLVERGVGVHTGDYLESASGHRSRRTVYISLGVRDRFPKVVRHDGVTLTAFFALECPVVEPRLYRDLDRIASAFRRVFSYSTPAALSPFLRRSVHLHRFMLPQSRDDVAEDAWSRPSRKFLTIINANKLPRVYLNELYTERLRAVEFFNRFGEIDLYGVGWDGPPFQMGETWVPAAARRVAYGARKRWHAIRPSRDPLLSAARQAYRGRARSKLEVLSDYTFAICFENSMLEGWITEKIFDCFYAGTVPVYWGPPDVEAWIPSECFVDMRRFEGYGELRDFLHSLSPQQIESYRLAARDFLASERFRPFSKRTFAERIGRLVEEDTGIRL